MPDKEVLMLMNLIFSNTSILKRESTNAMYQVSQIAARFSLQIKTHHNTSVTLS